MGWSARDDCEDLVGMDKLKIKWKWWNAKVKRERVETKICPMCGAVCNGAMGLVRHWDKCLEQS